MPPPPGASSDKYCFQAENVRGLTGTFSETITAFYASQPTIYITRMFAHTFHALGNFEHNSIGPCGRFDTCVSQERELSNTRVRRTG